MVVEPDSWLWPPDYEEGPNQVENFLDDLYEPNQQILQDLREFYRTLQVEPTEFIVWFGEKLYKNWKKEGF